MGAPTFSSALRTEIQRALGDTTGELSALLQPVRRKQAADRDLGALRRAGRYLKPKPKARTP